MSFKSTYFKIKDREILKMLKSAKIKQWFIGKIFYKMTSPPQFITFFYILSKRKALELLNFSTSGF